MTEQLRCCVVDPKADTAEKTKYKKSEPFIKADVKQTTRRAGEKLN